jgi:hypothetical protein
MKYRKAYESKQRQIWVPQEEYETLKGAELKEFHRTFCRARWRSSLDKLGELMKEKKTKEFFSDVRKMASRGNGAMATYCKVDREIKGTKDSMKVFVAFYRNLFANPRFEQRSRQWQQRDQVCLEIPSKEIKDAIKSIPKGKAISTDGLPDEAIKDIPAIRNKVIEIIRAILDGKKEIP